MIVGLVPTLTEKPMKPKHAKPVSAAEFCEYGVLSSENAFVIRRKLLRRLINSFTKAADRKPNTPTVRPHG